MKTTPNAPLAPLTSLGAGGAAETLIDIEIGDDVAAIVADLDHSRPLWVLGYGTNALISDAGLPGNVLRFHLGPAPTLEGTTITVDAGTEWDAVVKFAIDHNLWGLELTSGIPGSVGAAVIINITAYGQRIADVLAWVEVLDPATGEVKRVVASDLDYSYKDSLFHKPDSKLIVLRAAFKLSTNATQELEYESARKVAKELGLETNKLADRRTVVLESRKRVGAMWNESDPEREHTAGSFFKNPLVTPEQALEIAKFEERGIPVQKILEQNRVHGGDTTRVSAAHVLLAAGYSRGQAWGPVRLHPDSILKLENTGGATAQQIYDTAQEIIMVVHDKLGIQLEPEVRFLGDFMNHS